MSDIIVGAGHYGWKQIPGSPFEVATFPNDLAGTLHIQWNNEAANEWFQKMIDYNIGSIAYALRTYYGDYGG